MHQIIQNKFIQTVPQFLKTTSYIFCQLCMFYFHFRTKSNLFWLFIHVTTTPDSRPHQTSYFANDIWRYCRWWGDETMSVVSYVYQHMLHYLHEASLNADMQHKIVWVDLMMRKAFTPNKVNQHYTHQHTFYIAASSCRCVIQ